MSNSPTVDAAAKIWFRGLTRTFYKPFALEVRMDTLRSPSMEPTPENEINIPYLRRRLTRELLRYGMDESSALTVSASGAFDDMMVEEVYARLRRILEFFYKSGTCDVLIREPLNIRRKLERLADCIEALKPWVGVDAAKTIIARHMAILDLPPEELTWKIQFLVKNVPSEFLRSIFVSTYSSFLLLPQTELEQKTGWHGNMTVETFWNYIRLDATGRVVPLLTLMPDIKCGFTPLLERPLPLPRLGRPGFTLFPKEKKERKPPQPRRKKEEVVTQPESPPTPAVAPHSEEIILPIDEADLHVDCRILPECYRTPKKMEVEEGERDKIARHVEIFTHPKHIGMQSDAAYNYVLHRPWLLERSTEDLKRLVETLWELGVREQKLFDVTSKYASLLQLGYYKLSHVLEFLKRNPKCTLPDDLRDLSIPSEVWKSRLRRLNTKVILPTDARFSTALFARTEREFRHILNHQSR